MPIDRISPLGIKNAVDLTDFSNEEKQIIELLSMRDWYVTRSEKLEDKNGEMSLKALLVKPQEKVREAFNLQREVVVLFSPYKTLDARSLNGFELVNIPNGRVEEICGILISKDANPQRMVDSILKNNIESRIIVPFTYDELIGVKNPDYIVKRIRERFYSRDLFGIQEALTEDRYFFGRRDLIYDLVNQHLSGSCSGVFGLRKTGKTSILYGIQRTLDRKEAMSVYIDCLTLHLQSWNGALYEVISKVFKDCSLRRSELHSREEYSVESNAATLFQTDIEKAYILGKKRSILLIFDEIENITFETSPSDNWKNGSAFIKFWQTMRSVFQTLASRRVFTYLIAGTNPRCIEQPSINKTDNPIFIQFRPHYLESFSFDQTKEMLEKLGNYMGLSFEDPVIQRLVDDYGGHPMLIRQQCSFIHRQIEWGARPHAVSLSEYQGFRKNFYKETSGFIQYAKMILEVLKNWYGVEYEMLELLANDQVSQFLEIAEECPEMIAHLLNYGVIGYDVEKNEYYFKINVIQQYLKKKKGIKEVQKKNGVFVSYAHTDKAWLDRLQGHLKVLAATIPDLDIWSDEKIEAGQNWQDEISRSIENAKVAILLVSTPYLASSFISSKELPHILQKAAEGGLKVIPVLVAPCSYSRSSLATFQSLNDPAKTLSELDTPAQIDRVFISLTDKIASLFQEA